MNNKTPKPPQRMLYVLHDFPQLSETFIVTQIKELLRDGVNVEAVCSHFNSTSPALKQLSGWEGSFTASSISMPSSPKGRILSMWRPILKLARRGRLGALLGAFNFFKYGKEVTSLKLLYTAASFEQSRSYDSIIAHFGFMGNVALFLKNHRLATGQLSVFFHGYDVFLHPKRFGQRIYHDLTASDARLICNTPTLRAELATLTESNTDRFDTLPAAFDSSRFTYQKRPTTHDGNITILNIGRLVPFKGHEILIDAMSLVHGKYPCVKLKIIGQGPLESFLKQKIIDLNLGTCIQLCGAMAPDDVKKLADSCHFFVMSSRTTASGQKEAQGVVVLEAQSMGMPLVITRHSSFEDLTTEGEVSEFAAENDAASLADAIERMTLRRDDWQHMGEKARSFVESRFNQESIHRLFLKIASKNASPGERVDFFDA